MQCLGQRRGKVDPKDLQIDSLTKVATAQTSQLDSLRTTRDSTFTSATDVLEDSLLLMKNKNIILQSTLDSLNSGAGQLEALAIHEQNKEAAVNDSKELKELLDSGIITQEEFDNKKQKLLEKL